MAGGGLVVGLFVAIAAATLITNAAVVADETGTSGLIDPVELALFAPGGIGAIVSSLVLVTDAIRGYQATRRSMQRRRTE